MNTYIHYHVSSPAGGSIHVYVDDRDIKDCGERDAVAHAAWRKLFDSNKDAMGREMRGKDRNNAPTMLTKLIDKLGVDRVKKHFTLAIEYHREG
jgi:hypothetical protein